MMLRILFLVALAFAVCGTPATVSAQFVPGMAPADEAEEVIAEPPSPNDIRELSRLLTDPRMARWLEQLAEDGEGANGRESGERLTPQQWLNEGLAAAKAYVGHTFHAWRNVRAVTSDFAVGWREAMGTGESLRSLIYVIIFLVAGSGLEWLYWRYAFATRRRIERQAGNDDSQRWRPTLLRAALTLLGIGLFTAGTLAGFLSFDWPRLVELLVLSLLLSVVGVRIINAIAVFVLCPRVPALRPVALATPAARFIYRWLMLIAAIACTGGFATLALREMALVDGMARLVFTTTGTTVALLAVLALHRWRARFGRSSDPVRGTDAGRDVEFALVATVIGVTWALWMVGAFGLMWTLIAVMALLLVDRICKRVLRPVSTNVGREGEGDEGSEAQVAEEAPDAPSEEAAPRQHLYQPVLERFIRFVAVVSAILAVSAAWGVEWWNLSESSSLAGRVLMASVDVLVAALIADLIWTWARTAIDARMDDYEPPEAGHAPGPEARLATLLPLLRTILLVTLIVMVALIGLSSLGVNIGPLLASAGVVGIAIGFGAQTLVRDIVSGIFFLLDDAFRVGEYIEIDQLRGTVESISVRSLRLRHHRGAVHTVPFGEMKSLTNHSRDWVIMKLEFRVPFDTDLKLVKKLIKQIGAELQAHPELGPNFIEPLKSQGVRRMEEFNMVVGVKFMARPGEQWVIRRETFQRVRDAFDAHGIKLAERNVKVEVVGGEALSSDDRDAVVGAAQDAIEQQLDPAAAPVPR